MRACYFQDWFHCDYDDNLEKHQTPHTQWVVALLFSKLHACKWQLGQTPNTTHSMSGGPVIFEIASMFDMSMFEKQQGTKYTCYFQDCIQHVLFHRCSSASGSFEASQRIALSSAWREILRTISRHKQQFQLIATSQVPNVSPGVNTISGNTSAK
jgi:hypothetical protein